MARGRVHVTSFMLCDSRNYLNLGASVSSLVTPAWGGGGGP